LGRHILAELFNCDAKIINDTDKVEMYMKRAAIECGATIVKSVFHTFNPHGVSGVVVIAESHLAIHTWPEYGFASIDVFTCGDTVNPWIAINFLKVYFGACSIKTVELKRGQLKNRKILHHKPIVQ
jgi:S-adenosylmethionine decarboxylase